MNTFQAVCFLALGIIFLVNSVVFVPAVRYGVVLRLGGRTGRIMREGINFVIPFIDRWVFVSMELDTTPVTAKFFTNDNLEAVVSGSLQWIPSPLITNEQGQNRFLEIDESTISSGLTDAIESILGTIGGEEKAETFIFHRQALELRLNCELRFGRPPHLDQAAQSNWVEYYETNLHVIAERMKAQMKLSVSDFSPTEQRYGIEIVALLVKEVTFSERTRQAMEKKGQVVAELRASNDQMDRIDAFAKRLREDHGLQGQEAINTARIILGLADNRIITIEGLGKMGIDAILRSLQREDRLPS